MGTLNDLQGSALDPKPSQRVGLTFELGLQMVKEKRQWIEKKVRLEPHEAKLIEDAAHAARVPLSVFIRTMLVAGQPPKPAPPASGELSYGAMVLTSTVSGLISDFSLIEQHCLRLGEPFSRLSGAEGAIQKLRHDAQTIGFLNKSGSLSEPEIKRALIRLKPASRRLYDQLTKPLNRGVVVSNSVWREVLETLQSALAIDCSEVQSV